MYIQVVIKFYLLIWSQIEKDKIGSF